MIALAPNLFYGTTIAVTILVLAKNKTNTTKAIIRDMIFGNRRHFRELLTRSEEGIASNILADRLKRLVEQGIMTRADDPTHKQKAIYSLTEMAIDLVPLFAHMGAWGRKHLPVSEELSIRAELLEDGGPKLWEDFMDELRAKHLGKQLPPGTPSVLGRLTEAYLEIVNRKKSA